MKVSKEVWSKVGLDGGERERELDGKAKFRLLFMKT